MLYNKDWEIKIEVNPTADLLRKAADLIETRGHCKNVLWDNRGRLCFMGALYTASGKHYNSTVHAPAIAAVEEYLQLEGCKNSCDHVVNWNNKPERTAQEVIDAMRGAADALER